MSHLVASAFDLHQDAAPMVMRQLAEGDVAAPLVLQCTRQTAVPRNILNAADFSIVVQCSESRVRSASLQPVSLMIWLGRVRCVAFPHMFCAWHTTYRWTGMTKCRTCMPDLSLYTREP